MIGGANNISKWGKSVFSLAYYKVNENGVGAAAPLDYRLNPPMSTCTQTFILFNYTTTLLRGVL
jgi:hypothetical protein